MMNTQKYPRASRLIIPKQAGTMNKQAEERNQRADELSERMQARAEGRQDRSINQDELNQDSKPENTGIPALTESQDDKLDASGTQELPTKEAAEPEHSKQQTNGIDWEQRYNVLRGKYNAEVPAAMANVRELRTANVDLNTQIGTLNQKVSELTLALEGAKTPENNRLDNMRNDFGDDVPDEIEALKNEIADIKAKGQEEATIDDSVQAEPQDTYPNMKSGVSFVRTQVGEEEFARIDNDPGFKAYLDGIDPHHGIPRRDVMNTIFNNGDGDLYATANYYISWASQQATASNSADKREEMIEPGGNQNNPPVETKKIYKQSDIKQLYHEYTHNPKYQTKEGQEEFEAFELDLLAAGPEGRIR